MVDKHRPVVISLGMDKEPDVVPRHSFPPSLNAKQIEKLYGVTVEDDKRIKKVQIADTDDIVELCRSAVPELVRHAIELAGESENLKDVLSTLKELADRGYGRAQIIEGEGTALPLVIIKDYSGFKVAMPEAHEVIDVVATKRIPKPKKKPSVDVPL